MGQQLAVLQQTRHVNSEVGKRFLARPEDSHTVRNNDQSSFFSATAIAGLDTSPSKTGATAQATCGQGLLTVEHLDRSGVIWRTRVTESSECTHSSLVLWLTLVKAIGFGDLFAAATRSIFGVVEDSLHKANKGLTAITKMSVDLESCTDQSGT